MKRFYEKIHCINKGTRSIFLHYVLYSPCYYHDIRLSIGTAVLSANVDVHDGCIKNDYKIICSSSTVSEIEEFLIEYSSNKVEIEVTSINKVK